MLAAMDALQRRLMIREAEKRLEAARLLKAADDTSDSAHLLELLAFELILKLLVVEHTGKAAPWHHRYAEVFDLLPDEIQQNILQLAGERVGPSALSGEPNRVLKDLGSNFIGLRYPFQKYEGLSEHQYTELGEKWVNAGAPNAGAVFRYHPEELFGLIHAVKQVAGY